MTKDNGLQRESRVVCETCPDAEPCIRLVSRHYVTLSGARVRDINAIRMAAALQPGRDRLADVVDLALSEYGRQCREILVQRPELGLGGR